MKCRNTMTLMAILLLLLPCRGLSADIVVHPVRFAKGQTSTSIEGTIQGYQTIDYILRAKAGQTMQVTLKSNKGANSFNVLPPGSETAIAIGDLLGNSWTGTLPVDGEYRVRVFLHRSAARRNELAKYTLSFGFTGRGDTKVAGTNYHATGVVPCSVGTDPAGSSRCYFGVIRNGPGKADVHLAAAGFDVNLLKNPQRVLRFHGSTVQSSAPAETVTATKKDDNWLIKVNDFFFYLIPEAVIRGG
jgi:hypothetical protein